MFAFRAGGYVIEPHDELIHILFNQKITIDSSVSNNFKSYSPGREFDFTTLPKQMNYYVKEKTLISKSTSVKTGANELFEIPIGSIKYNLFTNISLYKRKYIKKGDPLGVGMPILCSSKDSLFFKIKERLFGYWQLSLDTFTDDVCILGIKQLLKKNKRNKTDEFVSIIMHPKTFSGESFKNLDSFVKRVKKIKEVKIVSFSEIRKMIGR